MRMLRLIQKGKPLFATLVSLRIEPLVTIELSSTYLDAVLFFSSVEDVTAKRESQSWEEKRLRGFYDCDWEWLTNAQKNTAQQLRKRLTDWGARLIEAVRKSALLDQTDEAEVKRMLRGMAAALLLKEFKYSAPFVVYEQDGVMGLAPAEQQETSSHVAQCANKFNRLTEQLFEKLDLLAPTPENLTRAIVSSQTPGVQKYRPNTAFIIMQIDDKVPRPANEITSARVARRTNRRNRRHKMRFIFIS